MPGTSLEGRSKNEMTRRAERLADEVAQAEQNVAELASFGQSTQAALHGAAGEARRLADVSRSIAVLAAESGEKMANAARAADGSRSSFEDLVTATQQIRDVIRLVTEIAAQTRLLALNATIEAARAGEAGRGFSVVASEVKNLAQETEKATDRVTSQIEAVAGLVSAVSASVDRIREDLAEAQRAGGEISAAVGEQDVATGNLAREVDAGARSAEDLANKLAVVARGVRQHVEEAQALARIAGAAKPR